MDAQIEQISSTELANATAEILNRACYGRQPIQVTRRGKPLVVIVDVETWENMTGKQSKREAFEELPY